MINGRMAEAAEALQVGSHQLLHQIGAGGMGTVWLAEHTTIGRRVAIKLLHHEYSLRPEMVTRFFNEARSAAAIADPGIVQIFDFGQHTDGRVYIVMELLEGEPLDRRLARLTRLPVSDALRIARQVASSLGAAHARGIVHRDLKPENIFMQLDNEVPGGERTKLLDFGIAKLLGDDAVTRMTSTSTIMGTPVFMSPEQCRGAGHVDTRSDIYSLGCVLFALITGRPPFEARGAGEIIVLHCTEEAPKASSRTSGVPAAVDKLIARCLEKDPEDRFQNGAELAKEIAAVVGAAAPQIEKVPRKTPKELPAIPSVTTTTLSGASAAIQAVRPPRNHLAIGATAAGVVVLAILIAVMATRSDSSDATPGAPPASAPQAKASVAKESPAKTATAPTKPAAAPTQPPPRTSPPTDPVAETAARMSKLAGTFDAWSHAHPTAPCPTVDDLADGDATIVDDAWGRPLQVTCTAQPSGQMVGLISPGADGVPDSGDDIESWNVAEVAPMLKGKRWKPKPPKSKPSVPGDVDGDGIPDIR